MHCFGRYLAGAALLLVSAGSVSPAAAQTAAPASQSNASAAERFGALDAVRDISLSPDGANIAFITPLPGQRRALYVVSTAEGATPRRVLVSDGDPQNLQWCQWVTNTRLVCQLYAQARLAGEVLGAVTMVAVDPATSAVRSLNVRRNERALFIDYRGGSVVDWQPGTADSVLMMRAYVPEVETGTRIASNREGMGVDQVNVVTGRTQRLEVPRTDATNYITDGRGKVRVLESQEYNEEDGRVSEMVRYFYRPAAGGRWQPLITYNSRTRQGTQIVSVDPESDRAIGFSQIDGRQAIVSVALDGTAAMTTLYAHPEVDIDGLIRIGRDRAIAGATFVTQKREAVFNDPALVRMTNALSRALNGRDIRIVDTNSDRSQYLINASADVNAGQYYLFTPANRQLRPLLDDRPALDGVALSPTRAITYAAADGTQIPGYLTLPPGRTDARGLPSIVLPHGGPESRDEWGFDWLVQFLAQSGYAVLQPNFRGSSGYGEQWLQKNGFQSWRTAVGDVTDAGRWLVANQGVDPAKMSIVGWSYGGYAALQSGVLAPNLFKSIVAIAPVTHMPQLRQDALDYAGYNLERDYIGTGPHLREGSPALNARSITAPVLLFHGTNDMNVRINQSRMMRGALNDAGKRVELIEYPGLAHSLETSEARTDMLRRIAAFLPR